MSEEKSQDTPPSWRTEFRVELYLILVGLAFGFSIENLLENPSLPKVLRFIATVIMLVVWLHAQIGFANSEKTFVKATSTWFSTVLLHYGEIASLILLVVVALVQQCEAQFYMAVAAAHGFDLLVQSFQIIRSKKANCRSRQRQELAKHWLTIDLITVGVAVGARVIMTSSSEFCVSMLVLLVIIATTLWDYSAHRLFYFGLPKPPCRKSDKVGRGAA